MNESEMKAKSVVSLFDEIANDTTISQDRRIDIISYCISEAYGAIELIRYRIDMEKALEHRQWAEQCEKDGIPF
jgi:hypothetical protein